MNSRKILRQATGKARRFLQVRFKRGYVAQQVLKRQGECNQCGNCCEILFRCPFLIKGEDGPSLCSIYADRPGQCAAFPINKKCLAEVDFDCTYSFSDPPVKASKNSLIQIESTTSSGKIT